MLMNKFKMGLTWHNCLTYQPKEDFNSYLLVTDGWDIQEMRWDRIWGGFRNKILSIRGEDLAKYWWADIVQTVHNTPEFKDGVDA